MRLLKPGFFKNEDLAKVSSDGRLLYAGLWSLADREGRLEDRPFRIRAELFPYQPIKIDRLLQELVNGGFIRRYAVEGRAYLVIPTFLDHQHPHPKEPKSTIPAPPAVKLHGITLPAVKLHGEQVAGPSDLDPVNSIQRKKDQRAGARPVHKLLIKIAHGVLDARDQGQIPNLDAELADELKTRAAQARIPYDGRAVTKALDSARVQRTRRA